MSKKSKVYDANTYKDKFEFDKITIPLGLELLSLGKSKYIDNYFKVESIRGANVIYLHVNNPSKTQKGKVRILSKNEVDHIEPKLSKEFATYDLMTYLDHDIRIHPSHTEIAKKNGKGELENYEFIIKLLLIKDRGVISLPYP